MTTNPLFKSIVDLEVLETCDIEAKRVFVQEDYYNPYELLTTVSDDYNLNISTLLQVLVGSSHVHEEANLLRSDANAFNINRNQSKNLLKALQENIVSIPKPKRRYI